MNQTIASADALIERVMESTIGLFDLAGIYLGQRLGLYRALDDGGPASSSELAERAGVDERYAREWLEHQAVTGLLTVDDASAAADERRYAMPHDYAAALVDADSPSYIAPLARRRWACCVRCRSWSMRSVPGTASPTTRTARTPGRGLPS